MLNLKKSIKRNLRNFKDKHIALKILIVCSRVFSSGQERLQKASYTKKTC